MLKRLKNRKRLGRFEREIQALGAMDSPRIPKTEDYSVGTPAYHVTADLGVGLDKYALAHPLKIDHALALFEQVVVAVRDAHEGAGVVHRDVKPNNVVVSSDGDEAYLIDFGICQYPDGERTLLTGEEAFGNPAFAAPEAFLGREDEPGPPCDVYSLGKVLYWMVSGGGHINRENLSQKVFDHLAADNDLVRAYVMRLLRGTVAEDPARRWTAPRLLEEVRATRQLVNRVGEYERRGEVVLTDGFGVGEAFNRSGSRSAASKDPDYPPGMQVVNLGDPPDDLDLGVAFEVPAGRDLRLESVSVALGYRAGEDELDVWVAPDIDGRPDSDEKLEAFRISGDRSLVPRVETVNSRGRPLLQGGRRYWLLFSVPAPRSEVAVWATALDLPPLPTAFAQRVDGGEWEVSESSSGPAYAVRVIGVQ